MPFRLVARGEGDCKTRYRPQRLSEICPTFSLKEARAILSDPNASQVYLFGGLTGAGKTTLARILARAIVCTCEDEKVEKPCLECAACVNMERIPDYLEINAAKFSGKDDTKKKIANMAYVGDYFGGKKIYIFDEVHGLTGAAQELLLKVLEEPKPGTLIFLCTTHVKGLKRTFLGRCATLNFKRLSLKQANAVVKQISVDSQIALPSDVIVESLFHKADGSVRDLLNLMDKVVLGSYDAGDSFESPDESHGAPNMMALVDAVKDKNWRVLRKILSTENVKNDPDGYRQTICTFLRREALRETTINLKIAKALGALSGSLADEPRDEQYNIFVLRCMRACYGNK